jgi:predicted RNase H-like HicB family nuclease
MRTVYFGAIVEAGNGVYGVYFPDLPGCVSAGNTFQEAARNAEEALALHLGGMIEDGEAIPAATAPEALECVPGSVEVARLLVRAELPGRSVRLNISMDEGLVAAVDLAAKTRSTTRSGLLADAVRQYLTR